MLHGLKEERVLWEDERKGRRKKGKIETGAESRLSFRGQAWKWVRRVIKKVIKVLDSSKTDKEGISKHNFCYMIMNEKKKIRAISVSFIHAIRNITEVSSVFNEKMLIQTICLSTETERENHEKRTLW